MSPAAAPKAPLAAATFASGSGTNVQALLDHPTDLWRIRLLVADRDGIGALERARQAGVATRVIRTKGRAEDEVAGETLAALEEHGVQVIFLAGYLKLVSAAVVTRFRKRILNIHPALLPSFGGKGMWGHHVHEAVLASGMRISGPSVHFVDEQYDRGTIVAQWPVPVLPDDTPDTLAARVLVFEHRLYPLAADHVCRAVLEGRESGPLVLPGEAFSLVPDTRLAGPAR